MTKICSLKTTLEKNNFKYWKNLGNVETEESNTGRQNNYFWNMSFIKNYFLGSGFSNSKSDYRRIGTNTKIFFMEFIFSESETWNDLQRFSIWRVNKCWHKIKDNKLTMLLGQKVIWWEFSRMESNIFNLN